jgi:hypothetical protein
MFALVLCTALGGAQAANDPLVAIQLKYPVNRITISTSSGNNVFYTVPQDAPIELKRAVKLVEVAERDVIIADGLQQLKLEIVQNERKLEALRAAFGEAAMRPKPANGFGNAGPGSQSGRYYMPQPFIFVDSPLRQFLAGELGSESTTERIIFSIDRLADAQLRLQRTWIDLAFPNGKGAVAQGADAEAGKNAVKRGVALINANTFPTIQVLRPVARRMTFDEATEVANALAAEDKKVQARVKDAMQQVEDASRKYRTAAAAERGTLRLEWNNAQKSLNAARAEAEAIRRRWTMASNYVLELTGDTPAKLLSEPKPRNSKTRE